VGSRRLEATQGQRPLPTKARKGEKREANINKFQKVTVNLNLVGGKV